MRKLITLFFTLLTIISLTGQSQMINEDFELFQGTDKILALDGLTVVPGWQAHPLIRQMGGALKIGQGGITAFIQTPGLNTTGDVKLTIKALAWTGSDAQPVKIYKNSTEIGVVTPIYAVRNDVTATPFETYSIDIANVQTGDKIKIEATLGKSFILDEISITNGTNTVLSEDFNKFSAGFSYTTNKTGATGTGANITGMCYPYIIGTLNAELNPFTIVNGWSAVGVLHNNGSVRLITRSGGDYRDASNAQVAENPSVTTPALNFTKTNADFTLTFDVTAIATNTAVEILLDGNLVKTEPVSTAMSAVTVEGSNANPNSKITIRPTSITTGDGITIDNIVISQKTPSSIVDNIKTADWNIRTSVNGFTIESSNPNLLTVLTVDGKSVFSKYIISGTNDIKLNNHGIYIVRFGSETVKFVY